MQAKLYMIFENLWREVENSFLKTSVVLAVKNLAVTGNKSMMIFNFWLISLMCCLFLWHGCVFVR
jgi:hypothetical protein